MKGNRARTIKSTLAVIATLVAAAVTMSAQAAVSVISYDFQTSGGNPSTPQTGVTASAVTEAGGLTLVYNHPDFRATGFAIGETLVTGNNDYFSFTLTPQTGFNVTVTGIQIFAGNVNVGGVNGPRQWALYQGEAALKTSAVMPVGSSSGATYMFPTPLQLTQGVTEFRLYGFNASSETGIGFMDQLNIGVDITAVPEPINVALAGFGLIFGGGMLSRRLLKKNSEILSNI